MNIQGTGIILEKRKLGEKSLLVKLFSQEHGIINGAINNANSKQMARIIQQGNLVSFCWQARLIEHLGVFKFELIQPISFKIFASQLKMQLIQSLLAILAFSLPEGVDELVIYNRVIKFLEILSTQEEVLIDYLYFEIEILSELGFKIDLDSCAVTNRSDGLYYISPKTGRAVIKEIGDPYCDQLFIIPDYFTKTRPISFQEMLDGLIITGHFLQKNIFNLKNINCLKSRDNLVDYIKAQLISA